jgi:hypothetical protein
LITSIVDGQSYPLLGHGLLSLTSEYIRVKVSSQSTVQLRNVRLLSTLTSQVM